jgi:4-amino-4-deoxy-L-arabinose transferase-like glycosyltransferase
VANLENVRINKSARRRMRQTLVWALLLMVGLGLLYGSGNRSYGLFDVDEAIFTQATLEMRAAEATHGMGALAMPTYNAEPRYHKPPLIYWLQSVSLSLTGTDFMPGGWGLVGARLPSLLSALLTVGLLGFGVWHLTRNARWALYASFILALNLSFFIIGRAATADGILNLTALALALWVLVLLFPSPLAPETPLRAQLRQRGRRLYMQRWGWVITGILGALAFLAKGPIGWLPAGLVALTLLWARPNRMLVWQILAPLNVVMLMGILLGPWLWLLFNQHGANFFYDFIVVHNLQRFGGDLGNSQSNFYGYYLIVLLVGFFPWVALLPTAVLDALRKPSGRWWRVAELRARMASHDAATALPLIALVWAGVFIVFFSFSGTKLAHYIVPAYPALAILIGGWLANTPRPMNGLTSTVWGVWGFILAGVLGIAAPLLMGLREATLHGWLALAQEFFGFTWPLPDTLAMAVLAQPINLGVGFWVAGGLMALLTLLVVLVRCGKAQLVPMLAAAQAGFLATLALGVVPLVWGYTQAPLATLANSLKALPPSSVVVHHGLHKPSLLLLSGHPFIKTDHPLQVLALLKQYPELWLVAEQPDLQPLLLELKNTQAGQVLDAKCSAGTCLVVLAPVKPSV